MYKEPDVPIPTTLFTLSCLPPSRLPPRLTSEIGLDWGPQRHQGEIVYDTCHCWPWRAVRLELKVWLQAHFSCHTWPGLNIGDLFAYAFVCLFAKCLQYAACKLLPQGDLCQHQEASMQAKAAAEIKWQNSTPQNPQRTQKWLERIHQNTSETALQLELNTFCRKCIQNKASFIITKWQTCRERKY